MLIALASTSVIRTKRAGCFQAAIVCYSRRILQRLPDVLKLKVQVVVDNLSRGPAISDKIDNQRPGDTHAVYTSLAAHSVRVSGIGHKLSLLAVCQGQKSAQFQTSFASLTSVKARAEQQTSLANVLGCGSKSALRPILHQRRI